MRYSKILKIALVIALTMFIVPFSFAGEPRSQPFLPEIPQTWTQIIPEPTEFMRILSFLF